jgi:hypothetical protein
MVHSDIFGRFAALVIQKQPFPNVFMKRKQLAEQEMTVVKILKGACVEIQQVSPCKVGVICHSSYTPKVLHFLSSPLFVEINILLTLFDFLFSLKDERTQTNTE